MLAKLGNSAYMTEYDGHRILVANCGRGVKGYSPIDLIANQEIEKAAGIAQKAFTLNL